MILRTLHNEDEAAFQAAIADFQTIQPVWPFAFHYDPSIAFSTFINLVNGWPEGRNLPQEGWVPNTFLVAVVGEDIVGRVSIRHKLTRWLEDIGGHIGYGICPSFRKNGYGKQVLTQSLVIAKKIGLDRALVTCDASNIASKKIIEHSGGVFDGRSKDTTLDEPKLRYWIDL